MRFRARVELWFEMSSLDKAEEASAAIETAAFDALGSAALPDPESGLL